MEILCFSIGIIIGFAIRGILVVLYEKKCKQRGYYGKFIKEKEVDKKIELPEEDDFDNEVLNTMFRFDKIMKKFNDITERKN